MKLYKINKKDLIWKETEYKINKINKNTPIIVDEKNNVVFGNNYKDQLEDEIICYCSNFPEEVNNALREIENALTKENNYLRIDKIRSTIISYIKSVLQPKTIMRLFEDFKEERMITKDNYICPSSYNNYTEY